MQDKLRDWAVSFLNKYINVPYLSEKQEGIIIKAVVDILLSFQPDQKEE